MRKAKKRIKECFKDVISKDCRNPVIFSRSHHKSLHLQSEAQWQLSKKVTSRFLRLLWIPFPDGVFMFVKKSLFAWVFLVLLTSLSTWGREFRCGDGDIVLGFTGDILVHDALYRSILNQQSFVPLWKEVTPLFQKAHYTVANLEGPAAWGIDRSGRDTGDSSFSYDLNIYSGTRFSFNFHPQILSDLKVSGIDLISTANNHSLDRQWRGVDRTLEASEEVGLATTGTRKSNSTQWFDHIAHIQGFRVAFLSCTASTNGIPDTKKQVLHCYDSQRTVERYIRSAIERRVADAVIVLPHWGEEYQQSPSSQQRLWGQRFLDAGALAVVGNHPHVLQPMEEYRDREGRKKVIAYSMGNFLAYQSKIPRKTGAVLYLKLTRANRDSQVEIESVGYSPTFREGLQVIPLNHRSRTGGFEEAAQFLGLENYLAPEESFSSCEF